MQENQLSNQIRHLDRHFMHRTHSFEWETKMKIHSEI